LDVDDDDDDDDDDDSSRIITPGWMLWQQKL
jgi:hypothetical protein